MSDVWDVYWNAESLRPSSRSDAAANVGLAIPFSILLTTFLHFFHRSLAWRCFSVAVVIAATTLLSLILEFGQGWFGHRVPSVQDTVAQLTGAAFGCVAGWWAAPRVVGALDELSNAPQRSLRIQAATTLAAMLTLLWSILPGQIIVSPVDYARKWSRGQIELVPFTLLDPWSWDAIYQAGWNVILGIPLGLWGYHTFRVVGRRPLTVPGQFLLLLGLGLLPEVLQLFVAKRFTSATDAIFVTMGTAIAFYSARWAWGDREIDGADESLRGHGGGNGWFRDPAVWFAFAVAFLMLLCLVAWFPFEFVTESTELKERLNEIAANPFSDYRGSNFQLLFGTLRTAALAGILGTLAGVAVGCIVNRRLRVVAFSLLLSAAIMASFGIELGQMLESSRTGGAGGFFTRVLGMWVGSAVGMMLMRGSADSTAGGSGKRGLIASGHAKS